MALRRQSASPAATLLRSSRLFALPSPLPRPDVTSDSGTGVQRVSPTATLPHPTHQAITTTKSSLARGDWGLKRPLPARSHLVQVADPVLRIAQLDTIEHITDFDSAADHVRTREKWETMGTPMMRGMAQLRDYDATGTPPSGAFETRDDTTSYQSDLGLDEASLYLRALEKSSRKRTKRTPKPTSAPPVTAAVHNARRWKHEGPWLPGMNAADFNTYLSNEIVQRREEFNRLLREYVWNDIYKARRRAARGSGDIIPVDVEEAEKWQQEQEERWADITPNDMDSGIKSLRRETLRDPLGSRLVNELILPFLRLPAVRFKNMVYAKDSQSGDLDKYQWDQETAPPSTHPSAGLGYLRSRSYLANHPILGPQSQPNPVEARVIQARTTASGKERYARLGVGGFVAKDELLSNETSSSSRANISNARDVETIDIETPGGKKVFVQPLYGSVSNDGRINIKVKRSHGPEVQVARGDLDDRPPVRKYVDADPVGSLTASRRGGANEFGENSSQAKQMNAILRQMVPPSTGRTLPGMLGSAEASRGQ